MDETERGETFTHGTFTLDAFRAKFKSRQLDQERRVEAMLEQTELSRQENALLWTQLENQCVCIQALHHIANNLGRVSQQDVSDLVGTSHRVDPFAKIPHPPINSLEGRDQSNARISRIVASKGADEVVSASHPR